MGRKVIVILSIVVVLGYAAFLWSITTLNESARTDIVDTEVAVSIEDGGNIAFPYCDYAVVVSKTNYLIRRAVSGDGTLGFEVRHDSSAENEALVAVVIPFGLPSNEVKITEEWQFVPASMGHYGSASQLFVWSGENRFVFMLITGTRPKSKGMVVDRTR